MSISPIAISGYGTYIFPVARRGHERLLLQQGKMHSDSSLRRIMFHPSMDTLPLRDQGLCAISTITI